jgi:hypothetical protein
MRYGKRPNLDLKLMRMMKPLREIVIHDITQAEFCVQLGTNIRLRAATTQIVGTQAPTLREMRKQNLAIHRMCKDPHHVWRLLWKLPMAQKSCTSLYLHQLYTLKCNGYHMTYKLTATTS